MAVEKCGFLRFFDGFSGQLSFIYREIRQMKCAECGKEKAPEAFNSECNTPTVCFKCRVSTINLGFGGYREFFHNDTIKGFQDRQVKEGRENGLDPVPITNHGAGPSATQIQKLQEHHLAKPTKEAI